MHVLCLHVDNLKVAISKTSDNLFPKHSNIEFYHMAWEQGYKLNQPL